MKRVLLMGCGRQRIDEYDTVRLDNNPDHEPDVLWDLTVHPLPFADEEFDEIHAYQVLEHLAYQGDYEFFFKEFTEYWRILKVGGTFIATVPTGAWVWGDPSHRRAITKETLAFLDQRNYAQVGETSMSDFRYLYKVSFEVIYSDMGDNFTFILRKV